MCIGVQVRTSGTLKRVGAYVGLRKSVPSGRIRRRRQGEDEGEDEQEDERDDEGGPADNRLGPRFVDLRKSVTSDKSVRIAEAVCCSFFYILWKNLPLIHVNSTSSST